MNISSIESKLIAQLAKDRAKPGRCSDGGDGVVNVQISGVSAGLLYALSDRTGQSSEAILRRLSNTD